MGTALRRFRERGANMKRPISLPDNVQQDKRKKERAEGVPLLDATFGGQGPVAEEKERVCPVGRRHVAP